MTAQRQQQLALERCDREIAEMIKQTHVAAWLVTLGLEDWEAEKRLIAAETADEEAL